MSARRSGQLPTVGIALAGVAVLHLLSLPLPFLLHRSRRLGEENARLAAGTPIREL